MSVVSLLKLPKLGWMKFRMSSELAGTMRSATIFRNGKHWFASILCEIDASDPVYFSISSVGIDRGVSIMDACSDGCMYPGAKAIHKHERKLARAQECGHSAYTDHNVVLKIFSGGLLQKHPCEMSIIMETA